MTLIDTEATRQFDRVEQALRLEITVANSAAAQLTRELADARKRNERQRAALERICRLATAHQVDWPALLAALREGLRT
jgi:hypothetical protein